MQCSECFTMYIMFACKVKRGSFVIVSGLLFTEESWEYSQAMKVNENRPTNACLLFILLISQNQGFSKSDIVGGINY